MKQHPISRDMLTELLRHTGRLTWGQSVNIAHMVMVMLQGGSLEEARAKYDTEEADDEAAMTDKPQTPSHES